MHAGVQWRSTEEGTPAARVELHVALGKQVLIDTYGSDDCLAATVEAGLTSALQVRPGELMVAGVRSAAAGCTITLKLSAPGVLRDLQHQLRDDCSALRSGMCSPFIGLCELGPVSRWLEAGDAQGPPRESAAPVASWEALPVAVAPVSTVSRLQRSDQTGVSSTRAVSQVVSSPIQRRNPAQAPRDEPVRGGHSGVGRSLRSLVPADASVRSVVHGREVVQSDAVFSPGPAELDPGRRWDLPYSGGFSVGSADFLSEPVPQRRADSSHNLVPGTQSGLRPAACPGSVEPRSTSPSRCAPLGGPDQFSAVLAEHSRHNKASKAPTRSGGQRSGDHRRPAEPVQRAGSPKVLRCDSLTRGAGAPQGLRRDGSLHAQVPERVTWAGQSHQISHPRFPAHAVGPAEGVFFTNRAHSGTEIPARRFSPNTRQAAALIEQGAGISSEIERKHREIVDPRAYIRHASSGGNQQTGEVPRASPRQVSSAMSWQQVHLERPSQSPAQPPDHRSPEGWRGGSPARPSPPRQAAGIPMRTAGLDSVRAGFAVGRLRSFTGAKDRLADPGSIFRRPPTAKPANVDQPDKLVREMISPHSTPGTVHRFRQAFTASVEEHDAGGAEHFYLASDSEDDAGASVGRARRLLQGNQRGLLTRALLSWKRFASRFPGLLPLLVSCQRMRWRLWLHGWQSYTKQARACRRVCLQWHEVACAARQQRRTLDCAAHAKFLRRFVVEWRFAARTFLVHRCLAAAESFWRSCFVRLIRLAWMQWVTRSRRWRMQVRTSDGRWAAACCALQKQALRGWWIVVSRCRTAERARFILRRSRLHRGLHRWLRSAKFARSSRRLVSLASWNWCRSAFEAWSVRAADRAMERCALLYARERRLREAVEAWRGVIWRKHLDGEPAHGEFPATRITTGEVSAVLHRLLRAKQELVACMNAEAG
mmetsp:Transcript_47797/g.126543  ORF Transcript_47797/g.126543 Transcript_47797/m.126543 type:complete len:933 (-) Transcript_47797:92-2890(-)